MKFQKLIVVMVALMISGCATVSGKACVSKNCSRPLSGSQQMVIWWPAGMRPGAVDTTIYTFKD